jgi:hypothetical protein
MGLIWGDNTEELKNLLRKDDIEKNPKGVLNGDGEISDEDAVCLLWTILFQEESQINSQLDFDHNGLINEADSMYLLWYTLFPDMFVLR